jgi:hypothetical protein
VVLPSTFPCVVLSSIAVKIEFGGSEIDLLMLRGEIIDGYM